MAKKKVGEHALPENLRMLDELIKRCYRELLKSIEENAKLGDFIKMVELRRKIAPSDTDQKKFWCMLEEIRKETEKRKSTPTGAKKGKGRGRR